MPYRFNVFTRNFDFSARIPQPYLPDPEATLESLKQTVTNLRNTLINAQIMNDSGAPEIFGDTITEIFGDTDTEIFADAE